MNVQIVAREQDDNDHQAEDFREEDIIRYYFNSGYSYKEIILFLERQHGLKISYRTLIRRLNQFGLRRRHNKDTQEYNTTVEIVRQQISQIVRGPGSLFGYRNLWHLLQLEGLHVPRSVVQFWLKEIDPEGSRLRKKQRLQRRQYNNPGPNYAWHIDGYDILKPWGFPIHGAIDVFSR